MTLGYLRPILDNRSKALGIVRLTLGIPGRIAERRVVVMGVPNVGFGGGNRRMFVETPACRDASMASLR